MLFKKIEKAVEESMPSDQSIAHRMDHLQRVRRNSLELAKNYNVDMEVLEIAALLHDVNQPIGKKNEHVEMSVDTAKKILESCTVEKEKAEKILRIVSEHSTERITNKSSMESKILFDADKLDGIGAVGIARVFSYSGQHSMSIKEAMAWYRKKIDIAINALNTKEAKEIAKEKLAYVEDFLYRLEKDV